MTGFPRYPYHLLPGGGRRRRHRGIFWFVWLGSHPVLLLISVVICVYFWAFMAAWVILVTLGWLLCGLVSLPFGGRRVRL